VGGPAEFYGRFGYKAQRSGDVSLAEPERRLRAGADQLEA